MGQLREAPAPVVALDELGDGGAHVGEILKDPAVDGLLLERAIPAFDDAVGLRLFEQAEAGAADALQVVPEGEDAAGAGESGLYFSIPMRPFRTTSMACVVMAPPRLMT